MNHKQQLFILEYAKNPNANQAAINAGYSAKTAYSQGQRLLKHAEIQEALHLALRHHVNSPIADSTARKTFWTQVMQDASQDMKHRLRASELLAKAKGDFTD